MTIALNAKIKDTALQMTSATAGTAQDFKLSDFIGKPISLKAEPSYTQEQYDIVLM